MIAEETSNVNTTHVFDSQHSKKSSPDKLLSNEQVEEEKTADPEKFLNKLSTFMTTANESSSFAIETVEESRG